MSRRGLRCGPPPPAGASGIDPVAQLLSVVDTRELDSAVDRAAVLGWRLDDTSYAGTRPLPWLPAIPQQLQQHQM